MGQHALLSPSSAEKWMGCPGSLRMCAGIPDTSSSYADEGTAAHFLAAECLRFGCDPEGFSDAIILVGHFPDEGDFTCWGIPPAGGVVRGTYVLAELPEMIEAVQTYVNSVRGHAEQGTLLVEQALPVGHLTGEEGATGTGDAVVLLSDELQVHDLKYGAGVRVSAENNKQLMIYASGALLAYCEFLDIDTVRLFIHQPRVSDTPSTWALSVEDLRKFEAQVRERAFHAMQCLNVEKYEAVVQHHLKPSEDACQWCLAKATCPGLAAYVQATVGAKFEDLSQVQDAKDLVPPDTAPADLATKMASVGLIEDWCKAVRARVESDLLADVPVPGWKLVQGRQGPRQWSNADAAEAALKAMRLKQEDMYDFKIISPTTAEKLAKAGTIGPRQWPKLQPLIMRKEGGLSVAPETDPRPAWQRASAEEMFEDVSLSGEFA